MSGFLGGPLPGNATDIGIPAGNPSWVPKKPSWFGGGGIEPIGAFDPNYEQFYDDGGWTETIIGPTQNEQIYRGTIGDSRWNQDINGGVANTDEWLRMLRDEREGNQFFDSQKAAAGLPSKKGSRDDSWAVPVTPSVTLTSDGDQFGSSNVYRNLATAGTGIGALQGGMRMAGQEMGIKDIAKMGAGALGGALKSKALYAINPVLGAVDQFYPGGIQQGFKDVTSCLLYTSPSPRDRTRSRMPSSA